MGHCLQYQSKLIGLLNQNGAAELHDIFQLFEATKKKLKSPPINLDELSDKIASCREAKESLAATEARFDSLREVYNTLSKFKVTVKDEEVLNLNNLDASFEEYAVFLTDAEKVLDKSKVTMKRELKIQMDGYGSQMSEIRAASHTELPFSNEVDPKHALEVIEAYKLKITKAKERETALATGLAIFSIPSTENTDLSCTHYGCRLFVADLDSHD